MPLPGCKVSCVLHRSQCRFPDSKFPAKATVLILRANQTLITWKLTKGPRLCQGGRTAIGGRPAVMRYTRREIMVKGGWRDAAMAMERKGEGFVLL